MTVLAGTPNLDLRRLTTLLADQYSIPGTLQELPSERDQNVLVSSNNERYVVKISNAHEEISFLDAQFQVLEVLAPALDVCPTVVRTRSGATLATIEDPDTGCAHAVRVVTWRPGTPLASVGYRSQALLTEVGATLGTMDALLSGFDHPAAHREFHWDLRHAKAVLADHRAGVSGDARAWIDAAETIYGREVEPRLSMLRTSVIHNDANDHNVLCGGGTDPWSRDQTVTGLIDFGDMVHSFTVANVAVAAAYVALGASDPLRAVGIVVAGYHREHPLTDDEFHAVWGMVLMRLATSLAVAATQHAERPDDHYLTVSQAPIAARLPKLLSCPYGYATATIRAAAEKAAVPAAPAVAAHVARLAAGAPPIFGVPFSTDNMIRVDLSVGSPVPAGDPGRYDPHTVGITAVEQEMAAAGVPYAYGAYGEPRLIYTHPMFDTGSSVLDERRTVHLAADLFADPGTPVHAVVGGTIHSVLASSEPQDYGHVILVRHRTPSGEPFWTLYGHLSADSLEMVSVGDQVEAGMQIGALGDPAENGMWSPHVHVMVITDLLDYTDDFSGVGVASQLEAWTTLALDPSHLVGVPDVLRANPPTGVETAAARERTMGPSVRLSYQRPVKLVRGWMQWMWDDMGRRYLDAYNNVPHVGHAHPKVVEAAVRQMSTLNTNTRYLHDGITRFAERLAATMPDPLEVCYFVNSASEANELAIRLARAHTGQRGMVVLEDAYHGHTSSLIDLSPYKHDGPGGEGSPSWVGRAPVADTYRGPFRANDPAAGQKYAAELGRVCEELAAGPDGLAGFIAETCPSVAGQISPPVGYLTAAYEEVRRRGGVIIADEVQTAYGRTGTFYAFEQHGVVPDVVVLGKPIGNGHPIGAVVTTREIAESFDTGMEFFSTFGGNTVSAAVGLAVLDVVQEEDITAHAADVGHYMVVSLAVLEERHHCIGDIRGRGLFIGVELVQDRETREPASEQASFVVNQLRERGILIGTDGPFDSVLKIRPPMPFDRTDADLLIEHLDTVLGWIR